MTSTAVTDDDLHALVDGQLDPARVDAVIDWLRAHPDDAVLVAQWQAQRLQLRQWHRAADPGPTPPTMARALRPRRAASLAWPAAAAVLLLGVGLAGGLLWSPLASPDGSATMAGVPRFVRDATIAHVVYAPERRHPVEVTADDEAHLVQWLGRRLGAPLRAPALQAQGFRLLGGRLLPGPGSPRAQFMYEDAQARRVTLYVTVFDDAQRPAETAFRAARDGAVESFYWVEGRFGYALSGELPPGEVVALARAVHAQLSR